MPLKLVANDEIHGETQQQDVSSRQNARLGPLRLRQPLIELLSQLRTVLSWLIYLVHRIPLFDITTLYDMDTTNSEAVLSCVALDLIIIIC